MAPAPKPARALLPCGMLLALGALVVGWLLAYRPDRPVPTLVPGSSRGPAFVVQVIRPRAGLPLGGALPPGLFGVDEALGFESKSPGAAVGSVESRSVELAADGWQLTLVLDAAGRATPETEVFFDLVFEERVRRVRCRPADPVVGTCETTALAGGAELSGRFELELARCEDATTGKPLGWPPSPLILRGSFDRLPLAATVEPR